MFAYRTMMVRIIKELIEVPEPRGRLTQRDIAKLAQVSQTTVSLVLNDRYLPGVRISAQTRQRVLQVINETGYMADPVARRLLDRQNQILGVFTYERVFPSTSADFYHPFMVGIEECAERLGCDLLLFTSAPIGTGRKIFQGNNRLRLADGCLLLGREIPVEELERLVAEDYPFVSVGRRDDAGGPVPYVGADYAAATADLAVRAFDLGHRSAAYVGSGAGSESAKDRLAGFNRSRRWSHQHIPVEGRPSGELLKSLLDSGVTVAFTEEFDTGSGLVEAAERRGLQVPGDLSVVVLGDPMNVTPNRRFTGFNIPRKAMGCQAVELLAGILTGDQGLTQRLVPCTLVEGTTLGRPRP